MNIELTTEQVRDVERLIAAIQNIGSQLGKLIDVADNIAIQVHDSAVAVGVEIQGHRTSTEGIKKQLIDIQHNGLPNKST